MMRTSAHDSADHKALRLFVRVTPKAGRDEITGLVEAPGGPALAVKVRAIADKGRANKAVIALIARWLGVAKSDVELVAGSRARLKTLKIAGDSAELARQIEDKLTARETS